MDSFEVTAFLVLYINPWIFSQYLKQLEINLRCLNKMKTNHNQGHKNTMGRKMQVKSSDIVREKC